MSRLLLADLQSTRTKRIATITAIAAAGCSFGLLSAQSEAGAAPSEDKMVTICHATGSSSNPWLKLTINESGLNGHKTSKHHEGADIRLSSADASCPSPHNPGEEEPPGEDHDYRVCHATGDSENPWEEQTYGSRGDLKKDHFGEGENNHVNDFEPEDGESCPAPIVTPEPEPEPAIVVEEVPVRQQTPAAVAAPAPQAQSAPSLAAPRSCGSRRSFRIRVRTRKADPVVRATVTVNGKRVRVLRGSRVTAPVVLTGLPKGRYSIEILATTRSGRQLSGVRRYRTCTPKSTRRTTPEL